EHRRDAGFTPLEKRGPFRAAAAQENRRQFFTQRRPMAAVVLPVYILGIEFDNFGESLKKLRLDRADGDIKPVGGLVGVVPGSAAVENIVAALGAPDAAGAQGTEHRHQRSDAIDHGGVDHIALASGASV